MIDPNVFDQLEERQGWMIPGTSDCFRIPIEFSAAAFRFGHSMVRDTYEYNKCHPVVSLGELLSRTGSQPGNAPLPAEWVIEWERFFYVGPSKFTVNFARKIDTKIAKGLHQLNQSTTAKFSVPSAPTRRRDKSSVPLVLESHLPVRTLIRGARMGLPSGQAVAKELHLPVLNAKDVANDPNREIIEKYGFDSDTPLWFYILKEAEVLGDANQPGKHLGPVGSRLVSDVILGALAADPTSYVSAAPKDWRPQFEEMPGLPTLTAGGSNCSS